MTTAVVQALNGLSAGAPPGGGKGGASGGPSGGGPPAGASFGVSSSSPGGGGSSTSFPAEGKMPFNVNLPVCAWREWNTRHKELVGFRQWLDQFSLWLNLIDTRFSGELREAMRWTRPLTKNDMDPEAYKRSFRLLSYLKQSLSGFDRAESDIATGEFFLLFFWIQAGSSRVVRGMRRADLGREVARPEACRSGREIARSEACRSEQGNGEAGGLQIPICRPQALRFPCRPRGSEQGNREAWGRSGSAGLRPRDFPPQICKLQPRDCPAPRVSTLSAD